VKLVDTLVVDKHTEDKDIAAAESAQAADMCMNMETGNPTNIGIFYLFFAMSFLIHSFTSILCMVLEDTVADTLRKGIRNLAFRACSKGMNISSRRPCRAMHNLHMVAHTDTVDGPTTILEATETLRKPMDYMDSPTAICRILCRSQIAIRVSAMAANS
jgi:hypothetical protein